MDEDRWVYNIWKDKYPCTYIENDKSKEPKKMTKLYEIKQNGEVCYGHKLAVNSQGQWVMEVKGTGTVIAVDKASVEEVLPHTVGVQFETNKTVYHYFAEKGAVEKGAFYIVDLMGRAIVQVTDVDTKNVDATKTLNVLAKLLTA
jgi:hypothetical protein